MARYLITLKSLDNDPEFDEKFNDGIEADGFTIIADHDGDGSTVAIHRMSIDTISGAMAASTQLLSAGILANAKREIKKLNQREELNNVFGALLGRE